MAFWLSSVCRLTPVTAATSAGPRAFDGKIVVVEADEGENKIVFAQKGGIFPPGFNTLTERLRTLEAAHSVDLDRTAQHMLQPEHSAAPGGASSRRRTQVVLPGSGRAADAAIAARVPFQCERTARKRAGLTGLCSNRKPLALASRSRSGAVSPVRMAAGTARPMARLTSVMASVPQSPSRNR